MAFIAQTGGDEVAQFVYGLLRVGTFRDENDLIAAEDFQSHKRRDTARVG